MYCFHSYLMKKKKTVSVSNDWHHFLNCVSTLNSPDRHTFNHLWPWDCQQCFFLYDIYFLSQMFWHCLNDFLIHECDDVWFCTHQACLHLCLLLFISAKHLSWIFHWTVKYKLWNMSWFSFSFMFSQCVFL